MYAKCISGFPRPGHICIAIATWLNISTQDFVYPEGIALPIGGDDKIHTHIMIEMHYDNPQELSG